MMARATSHSWAVRHKSWEMNSPRVRCEITFKHGQTHSNRFIYVLLNSFNGQAGCLGPICGMYRESYTRVACQVNGDLKEPTLACLALVCRLHSQKKGYWRVRLDKDWILPTRWSWITEFPLVTQEATGAPSFNGNGWQIPAFSSQNLLSQPR